MSTKANPAGPATPRPGERPKDQAKAPAAAPRRQPEVEEIGGPTGPEPTRYGDWEKGGRCSDF
jgi:hypothetical protein